MVSAADEVALVVIKSAADSIVTATLVGIIAIKAGELCIGGV